MDETANAQLRAMRESLERSERAQDVRERVVRVEAALPQKLDGEDAVRILTTARADSEKMVGQVIEKLQEFRLETRTAFQHAETERKLAALEASGAMESRLMNELAKVSAAVAAVTPAAAQQPAPPPPRPSPREAQFVAAASGSVVMSVITAVLSVLYALGVISFPGLQH